MNLENMQCNNCGATLEVPSSANFVTCNYCQSRLAIRRSETVKFTERVEELADTTERIDENLEVIKLQNELERIDREWTIEREQFRIHGKHGSRLPDTESGGAGPVLGVVMGVIFLGLFIVVGLGIAGGARAAGAPAMFALVPIGMIIFAVVAVVGGMVSSASKRNGYQQAERRYRDRRNSILNDIQQRQ